ncbi:ATP-binding protein [Kitasatospora sp. NBC_01250]|uniref:AAA family ATPase n=1 Tax=unclassified Kitasatospora TaxID=2633591 RepID=UPI002E14D291|nr:MULTISPECIES: ATP-binding protein [unclassified Kitasatospora]WSJ69509.1 ATP-binding protein [Kitasatospora sp. NBC_01302]
MTSEVVQRRTATPPTEPSAAATAGARPQARPTLRPTVEELRLTSFKSYRRATLPLAPLTVLHGPSGVGKSNALDALAVLSRLAHGEEVRPSLDGIGGAGGPLAAPIRGGLLGCVPHGRNAIILGCTVRSCAGPIRLELVIRTDVRVRVAREWLACDGRTLMETGEQDVAGGRVNVSWHNDSRQGDIRAPFPSGSLITAQLPLRVAGSSAGERKVLAAAEQMLTALREVFPVHPVPALMRGWARPDPQARLLPSAANVSAVLARLQGECPRRYGRLLKAVQAAAPHPLLGLDVARRGTQVQERLLAVFDEGVLGRTGADQASDGMLRVLAFAAVLLTGADVLDVDPAIEVPWARRQLAVLAEDVGAGLATEQTASLLRLAREMCDKEHLRLLAAVQDPAAAQSVDGIELVECRRDPTSGHSVLRSPAHRVPPQPGGAAAPGAEDAVDLDR